MLGAASYCPTLYARRAEIKALQQLPEASKDRLFPLIAARPWPNGKFLQLTWDRVQEALGARRFALDVDKSCLGAGGREPACSEFDSLFDPSEGFENYYDACEAIVSAVPVLRTGSAHNNQIAKQLDHIDRIDRGCVVHIQHGSAEDWHGVLSEVLQHTADAIVFINTGWRTDILSLEAWASGIVTIVNDINPLIEIVITGSSFPDAFSNMDEKGANPIVERMLFNNLVRRHNAAVMVYGDWGSARPPMPSTPMTIVPRIDLPTTEEWVSFRKVKSEGYPDIATRVMADALWSKSPDIWGKYAIEATAEELPGAFKNPEGASAARINIHLHRQAQYGAGFEIGDSEEPYTDD